MIELRTHPRYAPCSAPSSSTLNRSDRAPKVVAACLKQFQLQAPKTSGIRIDPLQRRPRAPFFMRRETPPRVHLRVRARQARATRRR